MGRTYFHSPGNAENALIADNAGNGNAVIDDW
jgi:hypothetical protein